MKLHVMVKSWKISQEIPQVPRWGSVVAEQIWCIKGKVMEIGMDNLNYLCPLMASKLTVPARKKLIIDVKMQWEHLLGVQRLSKSKQNLWAKKGSKKEMKSNTVLEGHTARDLCAWRPVPSSHRTVLQNHCCHLP